MFLCDEWLLLIKINVILLAVYPQVVLVYVGQLPAIASQMATSMAAFLQQFQWYLPFDTTPITPELYQGLIERINVTVQPNKVHATVVFVFLIRKIQLLLVFACQPSWLID